MSTWLWSLLAFITPSLCRQRGWIKRYPFSHSQLRLCWPCLSASCKRDRDIAQVRERLGGLQLGQGKEQVRNEVPLLPQPRLLTWSCTHLENLRAAAAALDGAAYPLGWDSRAPQSGTADISAFAGMRQCPGRDAEPAASWLASPSPSAVAGGLSRLLCPRLPPRSAIEVPRCSAI